MDSLDAINRRLGEIQDEMITLDDHEFARRNELGAERDSLRDQAATYVVDRDKNRPSSELIAELKARRSQLGSIAKRYVSGAKQTDGAFGGVGAYDGPADSITINKGIDEATGRAEVERRIAHLEGILKERGHL